ncbi:MAG: phosphoribosylamine--glycine ligase [Candidatus Binatia bacterium]
MKVLVVGSGGREHALCWKIADDDRVEAVLAAPGSAGIAAVAECVGVAADDVDGLASLAAERGVDLTVVGPEAPLAAGIVDGFRQRGLRIFGPDREGARLEASKAFAKKLFAEGGIPTAAYREFCDADEARRFARELGFPLVVKADGLAAGKGVIVCHDADAADLAIASMLVDKRFGDAGRVIVVEEFLDGEELSFMALTDGSVALPMASAQDHKALLDGDEGPNTGGMGAYSPAPLCTPRLADEIMSTVIEPLLGALRARDIEYRGVLYAGLMICDGHPRVLEFNVRFGDPECQPIMMRLRSSLVDLFEACLDGRLDTVRASWTEEAAACVVMASEGYPGAYRKGDPIAGIEEADSMAGVKVFHAGTAKDESGRWVSAGGRVLGVAARGAGVEQAVGLAYRGVAAISWRGAQYRGDIGRRALGL